MAEPVIAPSETELFSQMSVGHRHACGVRANGQIRCWGRNAGGESGVGTPGFLYDEMDTLSPTLNNSDFVQVSAGLRYSSCGLKKDGSVKCWGDHAVAISGNEHKHVKAGYRRVISGENIEEIARACVLTKDDLIQCNTIPGVADLSPPPTNVRFRQFSLGDFNDCGVTIAGTIECWGNDEFELPEENENFVKVSVGNTSVNFPSVTYACGLRKDGSVTCFGNYAGVVDETPEGTRFIDITTMATTACGIRKDDKKIECWGLNAFGVRSGNIDFCGDGDVLLGVEECEPSGSLGSCAELGLGTKLENVTPSCLSTCQIATRDCRPTTVSTGDFNACALSSEGDSTCWGNGISELVVRDLPIDAPQSTRFKVLSAGRRQICGLMLDNTIRCWGRNRFGEAGATWDDGNGNIVPGVLTNNQIGTTPYVALTVLNRNFSSVVSGSLSSCALKDDKSILCWGSHEDTLQGNDFVAIDKIRNRICGLRGDGSLVCKWKSQSNEEEIVDDVKHFSMALRTVCAVKTDGTIECFCDSPDACNISINENKNFVQVATSEDFFCGLKNDGKIFCWGSLGPESVPRNENYIQIDAGDDNICGVKNDNSIYCWGNEDDGIVRNYPGVVD